MSRLSGVPYLALSALMYVALVVSYRQARPEKSLPRGSYERTVTPPGSSWAGSTAPGRGTR
jgi:hypothetical protein